MSESIITFHDEQGRPHWCNPPEWYEKPFCLGMMYSCGHSFYCYADPSIIEHDKKHDRENRFLSLLVSLALTGVFVVFYLGKMGIL